MRIPLEYLADSVGTSQFKISYCTINIAFHVSKFDNVWCKQNLAKMRQNLMLISQFRKKYDFKPYLRVLRLLIFKKESAEPCNHRFNERGEIYFEAGVFDIAYAGGKFARFWPFFVKLA